MRNSRIAGLVMWAACGTLLVTGAALEAQSSARQGAKVVNSFDDPNWRATQAAWRPYTREEMMSAKSLDIPAVSEATLQQWAQDQLSGAVYDTKGGPQADPGGLPGGVKAPAVAAEFSVADPVAAALGPVERLGYGYPAPYTRYESFPSYTTYPYSTVGKVFFTIPGQGTYVCSASSIGGDAVIIAAHCVQDGTTGQFYTNWSFVPAYKNGATPYGQWSANYLWVNGAYKNGNDGDLRYDTGGAVLNRRNGQKLSSAVGFLGFAWNQSTNSTSAHWALIGYPQAAPFNGKLQYVCQASYAYSYGGSSPSPIGVGCDQTGGTSGGPWIRNFAGVAGATNYCNGVNSFRRCFDANCNSLYTQELFSPYFDNSTKKLKDCLVNSTPGHPANSNTCAPQ